MIFDRPGWLIGVLPAIAAVFLLARLARDRRLAAANAWSVSLGSAAALHGRRSPVVLALATLLMGIALAGPRWGLAERTTESRALNLVLVMDISKSMLAQDVKPSRLERANGVARRLVQDLSGDRLGLIAFAARPYLLAPLTLDQSALAIQLDALDPSVASEGGSSLADAMLAAREVALGSSEGGARVVVLMTDGESFDGADSLEKAGAALRRDNISLIVVPFGTTEGARIPDEVTAWHRDASGQPVVTVRRDDLIQVLAGAAGGTIVPPDAPDPGGAVRRALEGLERTAVKDRLAADLVPRAWLFALGALIVIGVHTMTRRSAALAGLLLMLGTVTSLPAQRPSEGARLLGRGDTTSAGNIFAELAKRRGSDTSWYNAGTAALFRGDISEARGGLERATTSLDPALRQRALYNLGTALLAQARVDSTGRDSTIAAAEAHLREALQLAPGDQAAKRNYEIARRLRPPPPPPKDGSSSQGSGGQQGEPPPGGDGGGMSAGEAEQVLNAMERAESATRRNLANQQRRTSSTGPDW